MRLSTKSEYGLLACYDLARFAGGSPVPLNAVAERQGISEAYLEQLIGALRRAGLVRSVRGAQGGYVLGRDARSITVGDVIRVLEGPIAPVGCVATDETGPGVCARSEGCVTRPIWERLRDSMELVLDSISLADLVADGSGSGGNPPPRGSPGARHFGGGTHDRDQDE